jgi:hypothetical protein
MATSASRLILVTHPITATTVTAASRITATAASTRATSSCAADAIPAVSAGSTSRVIAAGAIGRNYRDRRAPGGSNGAFAIAAPAAIGEVHARPLFDRKPAMLKLIDLEQVSSMSPLGPTAREQARDSPPRWRRRVRR